MHRIDYKKQLIETVTNFKANVDHQTGNNEFINETLTVTDPAGYGMPFTVSFNSNEQISIIDGKYPFRFNDLNIAEGLTQEQLTRLVRLILEGEIDIKPKIVNFRSFNMLMIDPKSGDKYYGSAKRSKGINKERLYSIQTGYSLKVN